MHTAGSQPQLVGLSVKYSIAKTQIGTMEIHDWFNHTWNDQVVESVSGGSLPETYSTTIGGGRLTVTLGATQFCWSIACPPEPRSRTTQKIVMPLLEEIKLSSQPHEFCLIPKGELLTRKKLHVYGRLEMTWNISQEVKGSSDHRFRYFCTERGNNV